MKHRGRQMNIKHFPSIFSHSEFLIHTCSMLKKRFRPQENKKHKYFRNVSKSVFKLKPFFFVWQLTNWTSCVCRILLFSAVWSVQHFLFQYKAPSGNCGCELALRIKLNWFETNHTWGVGSDTHHLWTSDVCEELLMNKGIGGWNHIQSFSLLFSGTS